MKTTRFDRGPAFSLSDRGGEWWTVLMGDEEYRDLKKSDFNHAAALECVKQMNQRRPTFEMKQIDLFPFEVVGAGGGAICDTRCLAEEAWGDRAAFENGGLTAFSYLWRRFGPPWHGTDDYKRLACYVLTTPDPDTFIAIDPSASPMRYNVAYIINKNLADRISCGRFFSCSDRWRKGHATQVRINEAMLAAMKELLRPVGVRDVKINLFGRTDEDIPEAERSIYAGYGVPREAMDELIKPTKT